MRYARQCPWPASHCPSTSSSLLSVAATEGRLKGSQLSQTLGPLAGEQKKVWPVLRGAGGTAAVSNEDTPLCFSSPRGVVVCCSY